MTPADSAPGAATPIIDAHVHVGAWDHADFLGRATTVAETLAVLDAAGVGGAALVPTDRRDNQGLLDGARAALRAGYKGALWVFPWVRPIEQGGEEDLRWLDANADAVVGVKIHPSLSRVRVSDPGFRPFLEWCGARGKVALVHCGRWQEMASWTFSLDAALAHPRARFILAHAGGDTPPLATAACEGVRERGVTNAWFEMSGLREYWVAARNIERLGADRYLMGSDFNLAHPAMYIAAVRGMGLSAADTAKVLGGNALALLGAPLVG